MVRLLYVLIIIVSPLSAQMPDSLFYGNSKKLLKNPYGWGFIAGRNAYNDIAKYQRFDVKEEITVIGTSIWMAVAKVVNTPDTITIVFKKTATGKQNYDSTSGGPGETIASIQKITTDFRDTMGNPVSFTLSKSFNVAGSTATPESIFVGIEWSSTANDTFALYTDSAGQGEKRNRAWEQVTGVSYTFQRFNESSDFAWELDADLWISLLYKHGLSSVRDDRGEPPKQFVLEQNYPNPFNPATTIRFSITTASTVSLVVYDMLGKEIAALVNEYLEPGTYTATFNAQSLSSGIYFYRLRSGIRSESKKMQLIR